MSGEESVAEQVYEAGLEIINPGGDPDVLRSAAQGWRNLQENLRTMFQDLDREVRRARDSGWCGPAADAFTEHWESLDAAMKKSLPQLSEAAESLDEAADAVEDVNREIHEIYLEIGISVGISVGMSFLTMGFSAAAGAARAAQLAARAARLARTLGTVLRKVGQAFTTISRLAKEHRFLKNVLVNWTSNTGGTVITNALTGQKTDLGDAVWQGGLSAVAGTGPGMLTTAGGKALGKAAGDLSNPLARGFGRHAGLLGDAAGGAAGSMTGGLTVDGVKNLDNDPSNDVSGRDMLWNAGVNGVGGAAGGAAVHGANTQLPPGREGPHFAVEGPAQGIVYGGAGAVAKPLHDALWPERPSEERSEAGGTSQGPKKGSVKDVFG
ncbi:WXG100 family type VII secretion target [Streptomyces albofaciens JCM 4342]|uniref:WXG100 family type VII secretion target n=1 Tax=Streptomyces albofaciens TaxID=66866 RepID=UPI00123851FA|nr:WXG100 family type VII secretion target [Streptomyces albofaciens]KAA6223988.1 WXG100 family type VII secretion target [Streptomyces albofaciens JCM 4342]